MNAIEKVQAITDRLQTALDQDDIELIEAVYVLVSRIERRI